MNEILYVIGAGGMVMYPLILLAILAVTVMIERLILFTEIGRSNPKLPKRTILKCKEKDFGGALNALKKTKGPLAASLQTIIEHRDKSVETIERYVQEVGEEYFNALEKRLSFLDTVTTISPLLGLLGTIVGMIGAFKAISAHGAGGNSDQILHGVAEALYATATGISVAVVCFIAYNYFTSRLRRITSETEIASTKLINEIMEKGHHEIQS